jgi:hypothetical protein
VRHFAGVFFGEWVGEAFAESQLASGDATLATAALRPARCGSFDDVWH